MQKRRMFSPDITESDSFLSMSSSSQSLYFHLCMNSDDEGVVNNPKKIQKIIDCNDDDLEELINKRFVISGFKSGVIVIKHWNINNSIRKDRATPSKYRKELDTLGTDENGAYYQKDKKSVK